MVKIFIFCLLGYTYFVEFYVCWINDLLFKLILGLIVRLVKMDNFFDNDEFQTV